MENVSLRVTSDGEGQRIDRWLSVQLPDLSRSRIQSLIKNGKVELDGQPVKANHRLHEGAGVTLVVPDPEPLELTPQDLPLDILHEDSEIIVVNKAPGMVVHPGAGRSDGTLVNALLFHCGELGGIGGVLRPGIVHRLDKDTSGTIVVAKTDNAMASLSAQFKQRLVSKDYLAVVWGTPRRCGTSREPVGRNPRDRKKMGVVQTGRSAVTHYETVESFTKMSLLRVAIETGRTHQIRVHMSHLGHPVVGDSRYGRHRAAGDLPVAVRRQMLHAERIAFAHPSDGRPVEFRAPLWDDMSALLEALRISAGRVDRQEE